MAQLKIESGPVLVLNAGSSSLKATLLEPPDRTILGATEVDLGADATRGPDLVTALDRAVGDLGDSASTVRAVGHRVVHGGSTFTRPTVVDDGVLASIEKLAPLAPLHNPIAVATIRAAREALPDIPHVAVFDTAFHASLAVDAITYAVPLAWTRDWGIRRFGFHGLAVEWVSRRVAEMLDRPLTELQIVVAHLGSGCSVTAVERGRSVDTSMGMTPLEGLVMGTRAGSIDPGIILSLLRDGRRTLKEMADDLDHGSGLLGMSGLSADVRQLLAAEARGTQAASLALDVFTRRAAAGIAAAATAMSGLDAIAFSGGIGEHSPELRGRIVRRLALLGVEPPPADESGADAGGTEDDRILWRSPGRPAIIRVAAREDIVIAESVVAVLN